MRDLCIVKTGETFTPLSKRRGDFEEWIEASLRLDPIAIRVVEVYKGDRLPDPALFSGVVITGSNAMVTDRVAWSEHTASWLPSVLETGTPLLAICYGHQLLAHGTGGIVGLNPRGSEVGTVEIRLSDAADGDPLFGSLPHMIRVHVSHFQSVLTPPAGATILAASVRDPHHAFSYGARAWSVQFHPEFDAEIAHAYIDQYSDAIRAEGTDPESSHGQVEDTPWGEMILNRFGDIVLREDG